MKNVRSVYVKLLWVAVAVYVIFVCLMQADLYAKIGRIESALVHAGAGGCGH